MHDCTSGLKGGAQTSSKDAVRFMMSSTQVDRK